MKQLRKILKLLGIVLLNLGLGSSVYTERLLNRNFEKSGKQGNFNYPMPNQSAGRQVSKLRLLDNSR